MKAIIKKINTFSFVRMSTREQSFFAKRLSFLTKTGIPMLESLVMIREQTKKSSYSVVLDTVIDDVSNGQYLSKSLARFKNIFGDFSINIIASGESGGILSENLEYLAEELRKKDLLKKKILGAFIYPLVIILATFAITGFLMIYLFPKMIPVFSSVRMDLPLSTKLMISISNFLTNHGLAFLGVILTLILFFIYLIKTNTKFRFYFDKYIIKIPGLGKLIKSYNLANSTRTMGLLLKTGMPLSEVVPITEKISINLVYKEEFKKIATKINRGEVMSSCFLKSQHLFPDILTQIVSVGEKSGNLSNSLIYLSKLFESEIEDFTKNINTLIEPVLMIFMGIVVGFIAISIITPIYGITQHLTPR